MTQENHFLCCYIRLVQAGKSPVSRRIEQFPCSFGRQEECTVPLQEHSVSGKHAELYWNTNGQLVLLDLDSTNGTWLGNMRLHEYVIDHPVRVRLGQARLDIALDEAGLDFLATQPIPQSPVDQAQPLENQTASTVQFASPQPAHPAEREGIVCPHCWHHFALEEFMFIARHQSLVGDPVLGPDAQQRFLPSRFTPEGNAIDAAGMSCPDMACPRCHLRIPRSTSEMPPLFLSIVGAPASGKSYFLTSMVWNLRRTFPKDFAISFTDTDAVNNHILNEFEEQLYLPADTEAPTALRKTELQGDLYNQVQLDNMLINLPKPFLFSISPEQHHPRYEKIRESMSRTLVLYDNAGEHFEPGMDSVDNPTTQHLLHSDTIFFLFDPTKDARFRQQLKNVPDPQLTPGTRVQRQGIVLTEMINRIKKYSGMKSGSKSCRTLVFILSKFDTWKQLLDIDLPEEPWAWDADSNTCALDLELLANVSFQLRCLLDRICPEIVATVESFSGEVVYLPNSALGHSPELDQDSGMLAIRPEDIRPFWPSVPMLYFFCISGMLPSLPPHLGHLPDTEAQIRCSRDMFFVTLPGLHKPLEVPVSFAGHQLRCPGTDMWFTLPPAP